MSEPTAKPLQFGMRAVILWMIAICMLVAAFGYWYRNTFVPRRQSDRIDELIGSLAARRPAGITRGQWSSAVGWTHNLHHNSLLMFQTDVATMAAFEKRLQTRLDGKVDMETIDWIWNEYAKTCPGGESYQRCKPLMLEEMARVGPNDVRLGMDVP
jgi:hypothetical protein